MPTLQKRHPSVTPPDSHGHTVHEPQQLTRYITHNAKIKPQGVVVYKRFHGFSHAHSDAELANLEKGASGQYNGYMSPATTRKVRKLLENWLLCVEQEITKDWTLDTVAEMAQTKKHEYYPTFVTLTLPAIQMHDDNYIKRHLLNRFLINLKSMHGVGHYFWRAEPQKSGGIHFHILCDKWIHWKAIRADWNKILDEHGYVDAYRKNQQERHKNGYNPDLSGIFHRINEAHNKHVAANLTINEKGQIVPVNANPFDRKGAVDAAKKRAFNAYESGQRNNWSDPNSTDIHAIEKVENITAYVVKYVTKSTNETITDPKANPEYDDEQPVSNDNPQEVRVVKTRKIIGRVWGCSDGLRTLNHYEAEIATDANFHTYTHDNQEFEMVCHLEKEAAEKLRMNPQDESVWRDEDSGVCVYRLDSKAYIFLRQHFPQVFENYSHHYAKQYAELYNKPVRTQKIVAIVAHIPELSHSLALSEKNNRHTANESYFNPRPEMGGFSLDADSVYVPF